MTLGYVISKKLKFGMWVVLLVRLPPLASLSVSPTPPPLNWWLNCFRGLLFGVCSFFRGMTVV